MTDESIFDVRCRTSQIGSACNTIELVYEGTRIMSVILSQKHLYIWSNVFDYARVHRFLVLSPRECMQFFIRHILAWNYVQTKATDSYSIIFFFLHILVYSDRIVIVNKDVDGVVATHKKNGWKKFSKRNEWTLNSVHHAMM